MLSQSQFSGTVEFDSWPLYAVGVIIVSHTETRT